MKTKVEPGRPLTYANPYPERDAALNSLTAAIIAITEPRSGFQVDRITGNRHFLPLPAPPKVGLTKSGWPDTKSMDDAELAAYRAATTEVSKKEMRLTAEAQAAKPVRDNLLKWSQDLCTQEEPFEWGSRAGVLSDADIADTIALRRQHDLLMRIAN